METQAAKKIRPLSGTTNKELLDRLKSDHGGCINSASHLEFYYRFGQNLYTKCRIVCSNHRCKEDLAKDIFQGAIVKGLKKISDFEYDPSDTEKAVRNKIIGWLGIIAQRLFLDYLSNTSKEAAFDEASPEDEPAEDTSDYAEEQHITISIERLRLQEAMALLNDRERYIIVVCADYGCINTLTEHLKNTGKQENKTRQKHLPDEVIERLCEELKISKGNLRAIKKRALGKLMAKLSENS